VIASFQSKALEHLYNGKPKLIEASLRRRIAFVLLALSAATRAEDMNLPGFGLHPLKGERAGTWAVSINKNWRITFRFENGNVHDVDFEDYH
jgi:proteic killer suppression protein